MEKKEHGASGKKKSGRGDFSGLRSRARQGGRVPSCPRRGNEAPLRIEKRRRQGKKETRKGDSGV